jgi:hypothetical protein
MRAHNGNKKEERLVNLNRTPQIQPDSVTKTLYQMHRNLDLRNLFPVRIPLLVDPDHSGSTTLQKKQNYSENCAKRQAFHRKPKKFW